MKFATKPRVAFVPEASGDTKRRRCRDRGAEGDEGVGAGERCPPSQAPSPEIFLIFLHENGAL